MDRIRTSLKIWIVLLFLSSFSSLAASYARDYSVYCGSGEYRCLNQLECVNADWFCDGQKDCGDNSDEQFCSTTKKCPKLFFRCAKRCIPLRWRCDGTEDCHNGEDEVGCNGDNPGFPCLPDQRQCSNDECIGKELFCNGLNDCEDGSDELNCPNDIDKVEGAKGLRHNLSTWLLRRRKNGTTCNKWGHELHRTATALYISNPAFFKPGNITGKEMAYELTIQLLSKFSLNRTMSSQELALYINGLVVACKDPKDFHGRDLVSDLRKRVEKEKYTNPFEIIALCNAGDSMTNKDVERISKAYDSQHRPFWTDIQALAVMAMVCLSRLPNVQVDQRNLRDMTSELKKRQHLNGTVENLKTTGLVLQALIAADSLKSGFDLEGAVKTLVQHQNSDGSFSTFLDIYYALPALSYGSLISINTSHCQKTANTKGEEAIKKLQSKSVKRIQVQYSVFIGEEVDLARTWKLKVPSESTLYTVMETIQEVDPRFKVEYNVINGKPYPCAMFNVEDDPESELYWFVYKRVTGSPTPQLLEASPVDMKVQENEELILWYKHGDWNDHKTTAKTSNERMSSTTASP